MEPAADGCRDADLTGDGFVDQFDFGIVLACLSGPTVPAGADCGP